MRGRYGAYRWSTVVALLLTTLAAGAHQQQQSVTRVLFNPRTGNIEVMHRFLIHDAEHAVQAVVGSDADVLASDRSRQQFATYIHKQFRLTDQNGDAIPLTLVGEELDGPFLWVYAEAPARQGITALVLAHDTLHELWPEQLNLVNVERNDETRSAVLGGNNREVTVQLP
ncbi:MAG: DUF6702 family protein [Pseudomonadota bacterium]